MGRRWAPARLARWSLCTGLVAGAVGLAGPGDLAPSTDRARSSAEAAPTLSLRLVGQAGGPVHAVLAEPARQLLLLGAGQGVTVLADDPQAGGQVLGRSEPLGAVVLGLAGGADRTLARLAAAPWLAALDLSDPARPARHPWDFDAVGPVRDALRDGDRLYLTDGGGGLLAYRWAQGQAPEAAWRLAVGAEVGQLATLPIQGRRLLLAAAGPGGLLILDVSAEGPPMQLARVPGDVVGVTASGRLAFLAQRDANVGGGAAPRLAIYDLTRPGNPLRIVEPRPDLTVGTRLTSDGVLLYSCAGSPPQLEAIDVRSPNQPRRRGFSDEPPAPPSWRRCEAVAAAGSRVYVASWPPVGTAGPEEIHGGLATYVRLPSSLLAFQGATDLRGNPGPLTVQTAAAWIGEGAAAGTPGSRLRRVDLVDPARPRLAGSLSVEVAPTPLGPGTPTPFSRAPALLGQGPWLHLGSERRYRRWELVSGNPIPAGELSLPPPLGGDEGRPALSAWGDGLAISLAGRDPGRIQRLAVDGQGAPVLGPIGSLDRLGQVTDLLEVEGQLVAAVRQGGLRILAAEGDSGRPREVASLPLPAESLSLAADGPLTFVANGEAGLISIDLSRPEEPVELSRQRWADQDSGAATLDLLLLPAPAWNHGRRSLVLLEGQGGPSPSARSLLRLIDAADPLRPRELLAAEVATGSALAALGGDLLVSGPESHLEIYRVAGLAPTTTPSASPSAGPSPGPSPGTGPSPGSSPTGTGVVGTPAPSPSSVRSPRLAWLPSLNLSLSFRRELLVLLDAGMDRAGGADWHLRLDLAEAAVAGLDPARDRAALLRFDGRGASLEVVGPPSAVRDGLARQRPAAEAPGRLDLALAAIPLVEPILAPATDRRSAVFLVLSGRGALLAGPLGAGGTGLDRAASLGWRGFALVHPADRPEDWGVHLGDRARARRSAQEAAAVLAAWQAGDWR